MTRITKEQLEADLKRVREERDAAVALADKHIKRASELEGELQATQEIAKDLENYLENERERHGDLIMDTQVAIKLVSEIMSKRRPPINTFSGNLPF